MPTMPTMIKTTTRTIDLCGYKVTGCIYPADLSVGIFEPHVEIEEIKLGGRPVDEETFEAMREGAAEDFMFALQDEELSAMEERDYSGDRFEERVWSR